MNFFWADNCPVKAEETFIMILNFKSPAKIVMISYL